MNTKKIIIIGIVLVLAAVIVFLGYDFYKKNTTGIEVSIENVSGLKFKKVTLLHVNKNKKEEFYNIGSDYFVGTKVITNVEDSIRIICEKEDGGIYEQDIINKFEKGAQGYKGFEIRVKDDKILVVEMEH